jgi:hypothetical protein
MIDTAGMNCDEINDVIYDIRDGIIRNEDVIWHFYEPNNQKKQCKFKKGDIVKIKDNYLVVVSENSDDNVFFVTTPDAFIYVEDSQTYTYGYANSGWEKIDDNVIKIGHISFA